MFESWVWVLLGFGVVALAIRLVVSRERRETWIRDSRVPWFRLAIGVYGAYLLLILLRNQVGNDSVRSAVRAISYCALLLAWTFFSLGNARSRQNHPQGRQRQRTWWDEPSAQTDGPPEVTTGLITFGTAALGVAVVAAFILFSIGRD